MQRRSHRRSGAIPVALRLGSTALVCILTWHACALEPAHPSLLFSDADIPHLREKVESGWQKQAFDVMTERAEGFLDVPTDPYPLHMRGTNGPATTGRALNNRVSTLAMTGLLTGSAQYREHAVDMVIAAAHQSDVADFVEWNGHLAVGDGAHAYAMAYDWLWADMTEDERSLVREEITAFGQWIYDYSRKGRDFGLFTPNRLSCNHNAVVHAGLGFCALVLGEHGEWLKQAEKYVKGYLQYARDETGYNYEGIGYYAYGSWAAIPFGVALKRAGKGDIFREMDTLRLIPHYVLRQILPWGSHVVTMNDSPPRLGSSGGLMYLLSRYQDRVGLWGWLRLYGAEGSGSFGADPRGYLGDAASVPYTLLFADPSLKPLPPQEANLPLHAFFGSGRASFRSGWGDLDALATFTCGFDRHRGHNHRDENSFTFFARGESFAIDPGYEPRGTRSHNSVLVDGMGQASDKGEYDVYGRTERVREFGTAWSIAGDATDAFPEQARVSRARRQFLFVKAGTPYLVIADELTTPTGGDAEYAWLLHTARGNTIRVEQERNSAFIEGSRRKAICMVRFICPQEGLQITETDLAGETFERRGRTYRYDRFFRELRAVYRTDKARFIAVLAAADKQEDLPRVRWEGSPSDMYLEVRPSAEHTDRIHITCQSIQFERHVNESPDPH
ncbi:MAG: hypothetical protein HN742_34815 [Lentisphaerae bacterium]|jgi:hypothetical protein|nr:hypothetical protein [Lentisphaerota bacterium]MBT4817501.1 hypothetical protein [Lentisphaerota bacterium]MBT5612985.1 hypothetical protein [Lentisphaerota bacterium]MBT7059063.1 hypothetical protein [Lentisphaerota bacterium]MBT7847095.1 hypothetical protein [Lentisphaerota bacterium]